MALGASTTIRRSSTRALGGERSLALAFVAPALIVLAVLVGGGMIYALFLSLNKVTYTAGSPVYTWIGLSNYADLIHDPQVRTALWQTLIFMVVRVSATLMIAMAIALTINQKLPGLRVIRSLFLIPWALSSVVNGLMWGWIFNGNFGVANAVLSQVGLLDRYHSWLGDPGTAMGAIIFADTWKAVPFSSLMFLAALQGVPRDLIDAARVDGAGVVSRFRQVMLPAIRPVLLVVLIIETMWALKAFDLIWVLTQGGPLDATLVLNVYAYQQTFQFFNFGYGASIAYFVAMMILGLTAVYFAVLKEDQDVR
jgi:multiple sugar transport system permease protein